MRKAEEIRKQRRFEEKHEAYSKDLDKEEKERIDQERYAKQCFRLRADYRAINFNEKFFELLWKRDWVVTCEGYYAQINKELALSNVTSARNSAREFMTPHLSPSA